ncbi:MAG TPA: hypothetical protein VK879_05545 [Candidatus Sulfomarinibacteraceae bacterium]|nr:hypothetical protein [Candidatus Sulfomarinibacteraceae bacterium]
MRKRRPMLVGLTAGALAGLLVGLLLFRLNMGLIFLALGLFMGFLGGLAGKWTDNEIIAAFVGFFLTALTEGVLVIVLVSQIQAQ